jgi:quinoprotein glucose dehydrogenase
MSVRRVLMFGAAVAVAAATIEGASSARKAGEWIDYAGDASGQKYSPLAQINEKNVQDLEIVWKWTTADRDVQMSNAQLRASRYQDTPLMANGVLYTVTPLGMVAALDPGTGKTRWVFDPRSYDAPKPHSVGWTVRGVAYWSDGTRERIFHATTDAYLISIDAKTGKADPSFGREGKIDLIEGVPRNPIRSVNFAGRRPLVAGNVIVVGSHIRTATPGKEEETPPGDVRAFDARTGKRLWTFHIVPRKGEPGYETWLEGSAERVGNTNAWGGMARAPATTCSATACCASTRRPASASGTTRSFTTISGTTTSSLTRSSWTSPSTGARSRRWSVSARAARSSCSIARRGSRYGRSPRRRCRRRRRRTAR